MKLLVSDFNSNHIVDLIFIIYEINIAFIRFCYFIIYLFQFLLFYQFQLVGLIFYYFII